MRQRLAGAALTLAIPLMVEGQSPVAPATAVFAGAVLADSTERPIGGAEIAIGSLRLEARSDSSGAFTLPGIRAGRHLVTVRAVGYREFSAMLEFRAGQRLETDVVLASAAQSLAKVDVRESAPSGDHPLIREFDERRKMGMGHFLTQAEMGQAEGRKVMEFLTGQMPGLRIWGTRTGARMLVSGRGTVSFRQQQCPVRLVYDGIPMSDLSGSPSLDLDTIEPSTIAGVEYYTPANLPARFNFGGNNPCGTLLLWSRWKPK